MAYDLTYQARFSELFEGLNAEQRRAASAIDGPMLVVAGPGTGKTHLLAARIGQILLQTDSAPHNILCLTFTDAGVQAMRQRLLRYIGAEAHRLHIFTFHSFCSLVISDNAEYFGKNEAEPLSDLERIELIRTLIDSLPPTHLLKRLKNNPYYDEKRLHELWRTMKAENWSVEFVQQHIDQFIAEIPQNEAFIYKKGNAALGIKKGDLNQNAANECLEKLAKTRAAAHLFTQYQQLLHERGRYDFEDMLQWVRKGFATNSFLLRRYQEQYLYVLIDEFQDTNGTQNEILRLLTAYWDKPNVFAVGDDDQAIYEFQGARLKNILEFYAHYKNDIELVVLEANYRATQPLLDAASAVIATNQMRLAQQIGIDKYLKAADKAVNFPALLPKMVVYPNNLHEEIDIVQQIIALRDRGIPLSEIAVIYREHRQATRLMQLLQKHGIFFEARRPINVLETPLISSILTILAYLEAEHRQPFSGEAYLYEILYLECTKIPLELIYKLPFPTEKTALSAVTDEDFDTKIIATQTRNLYSFLLEEGEKTHAIWLSEPGVRLMTALKSLQKSYNNVPIVVLIEQIINKTGLLVWIDEQADRFTQLQIWQTFTTWLQNQAMRNPRLALADLRRLLTAMQEAKIDLPLLQTSLLNDAVVLTTAHSAKGLEFEYVFMLDCTAESWEPKRRNKGFLLPETLTLTNTTESETEANRRLFYVAMTRAKAFLHLSYGKKDIAEKHSKTPFLNESIYQHVVDFSEKTVSDTDLAAAQQRLFTGQSEVVISPFLTKSELMVLLDDFALSASSLNRFLRCPLSFYYQNVLRAPSAGSPNLVYGTAVHIALQRLYLRQAKQKTKKMPSVGVFVKDFEQEMLRNAAVLSAKELSRLLDYGKKTLPLYYEARAATWRKEAKVEYKLSRVTWRGVPLTGVVDKMENGMYDNLKHVTDFKTAKPTTAKPVRPDEKNPIGNEYWRQLAFYKLLIENYNHLDWFLEQATIDCVEPNARGEFEQFTLRIGLEDFEQFKKLVFEAWERIKAHDFTTGCGKVDCSWCNFTRRTVLKGDSWHDDLEAEMDD